MARTLNQTEREALAAMVGRTSLAQVLEVARSMAPPDEPTKCEACGEPLGFDAWVDSKGELLAGPYDDHMCLTEGCKNNR